MQTALEIPHAPRSFKLGCGRAALQKQPSGSLAKERRRQPEKTRQRCQRAGTDNLWYQPWRFLGEVLDALVVDVHR